MKRNEYPMTVPLEDLPEKLNSRPGGEMLPGFFVCVLFYTNCHFGQEGVDSLKRCMGDGLK